MHVRSMQAIDWAESAQNEPEGVSKYMETLTKETATLQKVLAKHLGEGVVMSIMGPVFQSYRQQLQEAFDGVEIHSEAEKKRMLNDVTYFSARIGRLEGSSDLGEHMVEVVKRKQITAKVNSTDSQTKPGDERGKELSTSSNGHAA